MIQGIFINEFYYEKNSGRSAERPDIYVYGPVCHTGSFIQYFSAAL